MLENLLVFCHYLEGLYFTVTTFRYIFLLLLCHRDVELKHDSRCLSETYLDFLTPDNLLKTEGYNLVCAYHPNKIKRGRVSI